MAPSNREVEIHLPFEKLIETVCKLPPEDLTEIKRRIEFRLQQTDTSESREDTEFWNTDLGREILAEADPSISLDEALKITSRIKGSLASDIIAEREER
jgi:hypothetical protein